MCLEGYFLKECYILLKEILCIHIYIYLYYNQSLLNVVLLDVGFYPSLLVVFCAPTLVPPLYGPWVQSRRGGAFACGQPFLPVGKVDRSSCEVGCSWGPAI